MTGRQGKPRGMGGLAIASAILLNSCAHQPVPVAVAPPIEAAPPRPVLAESLATVPLPPAAADGGWATINHDIDADHAAWHLRAALNVAAIGCRGTADAGIVPAYNRILSGQKADLARINTAIEAEYRKRYGAASWQGEHDRYMTRLYNFFSMPVAKPGFCQAADAIAPQAATVPAGQLPAFAKTALPQLEAPFTTIFQQVVETRTAIAAWDARYGAVPRTEMAAAAPAPALARPAPMTAASGPAPQLRYADMGRLIDWQPRPLAALAMR